MPQDLQRSRRFARLAILLLLVGLSATAALPPNPLPGLRYTDEFFPGTSYRADVPSLQDLLGFPAAERAATSEQIRHCLHAWTNAAPDRTRLVEYARSHEGRPLHYLVITSPGNLSRLEAIREDVERLGDPRITTAAEAEELIGRLPAVVWLAGTIHGDETEGSDAMLTVIHHLLAADEASVSRMLEEMVVIIDPLMNPDGRDRFLTMVAEHRGTAPNVDDQSLLHTGYWPRGRGNHYLFDLNRDWLFAVHPESRGRIREVGRWNPLLFVDAHGMGSQDTHLFSPAREPINPNVSPARRHWGPIFAQDQARAFDQHGLVYYTGEWNEEWYPGYSDSWAAYRGVLGILYEQARVAADGVRRPEGRILSYRESVLHHVIGAMANLRTAQAHARELLADYRANRVQALDPAGRYGHRTFAILPTPNGSRLRDFVDLLRLQGFELHQAARDITVASAVDGLGRESKGLTLPAGTLLVANRQPLAALLAAFLEFDPRMSDVALAEERQELLRTGDSRLYDTTAWNLTQMFGLPAFTLPTDLPEGSIPYAPPPPAPGGILPSERSPVAWVVNGADDASVTLAARLLERGVQVRAATRPFAFDGREFARGSLVITRLDNRVLAGDLEATVDAAAKECAMTAYPAVSGLGPGDLPDLGGGYFERLEPLRIATFSRGGVAATDYGSIWHTLDHRLGIRHTQLNGDGGGDLARYNVLIVPSGLDGMDDRRPALREWVEAGGTLIVSSGSTGALTAESAHFSRVRSLPDVLDRLPEFELTVLREWQGRTGGLPSLEQVWAHQPPDRLTYPWEQAGGAYPEEKELKKRDAWQQLFMPSGAILAGRIDTNHWLTAGCPEPLPLLAFRGAVLMAAGGVEAPIRYGLLSPGTRTAPTETRPASGADQTATNDEKGKKEPSGASRVGWASLPSGTQMHLRMSGLVWPEATYRLAHSAWVTRERLGRGQVILFASPPTFRSGARGAMRVFLNAVVLGPGLGTRPPMRP